jgi:hypothetical protein
MVIAARDFLHLYTGERFSKSNMGGDGCPGFCLDRKQLDRCTAFCEYAFVREVIQIIIKHQSQGNLSPGSGQRNNDV